MNVNSSQFNVHQALSILSYFKLFEELFEENGILVD